MSLSKDYQPFASMCSCYSPEHTVSVYPDDGEVYITFQLNKPSLWERLKYLLGIYPHQTYVEVCLDKNHIEVLERIKSYLTEKDTTEDVTIKE